ncbi:unnamed protein product, partial [Polarella glacialis]
GAAPQRDIAAYTSATRACELAGRWDVALDLLEAMKAERLRPGKVAYTAAISVCAAAQQWERSLLLLQDAALMKFSNGYRNVSAAVVYAC